MQVGLNTMARRVCKNIRALPLGQAVAAYNAQRGPTTWVQTRNELVATCKKAGRKKEPDLFEYEDR